MAVVRTILKIPLQDREHELHVVREDRAPYILISLSRPGQKWVRSRATIKLPDADAMRLGKFLCGIREIDGVQTEKIVRESTLPNYDGEGGEAVTTRTSRRGGNE